jgi:hypothetical protein
MRESSKRSFLKRASTLAVSANHLDSMTSQLKKDLQKHIQKAGSIPWQEPG